MKKQVFYIHGGTAYSNYDNFLSDLQNKTLWSPAGEISKTWYQTLREDLGDSYEVFTPQMPNKQNAKYEEWKIWFERHFEYLRDDTILIGCSLGAMFLYKYLIENKPEFSIKSVIFMASPAPELLPEEEKDCGDFFFKLEDVHILQKQCDRVVIMHSKDDFVVPYEHALELKEALPEAELVTFKDKNHFLVEELPELIEMIKGLG